MSTCIRLAAARDAEALLAIYAPIVAETTISFELEPPTSEDMQRRIITTLPQYPWLVCETAGDILGYAYASKHRERAAYQWSVDVSVYTHTRARRSGVGRALYTSLFALLRLQGFYNAYAGITLPNQASVGIHEALGFRPLGVYTAVGYKLGGWHDVCWWQLALREHAGTPRPPAPFAALPQDAAWEAALEAGLAHLRLSGSHGGTTVQVLAH
ncbi:MAG: arsinothricin resistance N-acetyltransferase ArsN1 family B [Roseiflexaceae bacterium]